MKTLFVLIILVALGLVGSAFFGVYTAPGLEGLPTVESLGKEREKAQSDRAREIYEGKSPATPPLPVNTNGAATRRNNQLNQQQNQAEGR